jgi:hypothetical protein
MLAAFVQPALWEMLLVRLEMWLKAAWDASAGIIWWKSSRAAE